MKIVNEPIYLQLVDILKKLINSDEYTLGDQFLTEKLICLNYNVSRNTAGKAISTLISDGFLELKKGIGTFVINKGNIIELQNLVSFTSMVDIMGSTASTEVIEFRSLQVAETEEQITEILQLSDADSRLFYCKRLRGLNGRPIAMEHHYINAVYCPDMTQEDSGGSMIEYWKFQCKLEIALVEQSITAICLSPEEAAVLGNADDNSAFLLQSSGILKNGRILWHEKSVLPGCRYVIKNSILI